MTLAPTALPASAAPPSGTRRGGYRPELHGLRALAVALVVTYHVWFGRISGGVDVFFLLTGFLLVGRLVPAAAAGPLALRTMWARNAARLLPAAALVLFGVLGAATMLLPPGRLAQTVGDVVASATFVENWELAQRSVDYAARGETTSVVQHFWSLSIQGQVLVAFPLLVALIGWAGRGPRLRGRVAWLLAVLTLASLAFSIVLTILDQPLAYFHSLTRVWEFGLGGLLALFIDEMALRRRTRIVLGWVGVLGLLSCGAVLGSGSAFPGAAALWPTGSAALVLIAGTTGERGSADWLLTRRPMRYLGDLSYTLYLWHWPVLIFMVAALDRPRLGPLLGLGVVAVSVALAVATHHLVERPSGWRVASAGFVSVLTVGILAQSYVTTVATAPVATGDERHPGALVLAGVAQPVAGVPAVPSMLTVRQDWVRTDLWNCRPMAESTRKVCFQPIDYEPVRRIAVVGDSHVQQYAGALEPLARRHHWQLVSFIFPGCAFTTDAIDDDVESPCGRWNQAVVGEIAALKPDAVVTMATHNVRIGLTETLPPGFVRQWQRLDVLGVPVLAIRDNPRFAGSPADCLQRRGREDPGCGVARAAVYAAEPPWARLTLPPNVTFLDTADLLCDTTRCPAEVGNVLVYMDDNHVSGTYAGTLASVIDKKVTDSLGW